MKQLVPTFQKTEELTLLVGLIHQTQNETKVNEYLDELEFLALTAGAKVIKRFTQRLDRPDVRTFVGEGKLKQIKEFVEEYKIDNLIIDDELSPAQQRNIEKELNGDTSNYDPDKHLCKVLDRTRLILDIFAKRAQTAYAKTQVELAQYEYLLPRLTGMWSHLDRIKGGIGMKGAGEKEIETDRRIIRDKISFLKERLKEIDKQMATQRKSRGELIRVALVGYTNVGKSTIMNMLSKSEVFAENKLFATLDTTVRKVVIENVPFLLSDTVGFIRKLPTQLVESFKSTLDEAREADLLLHVVDISHPQFTDHIKVVNETLNSIGCVNKPMIIVFNKIDAYKTEEENGLTLEEFKNSWMAAEQTQALFISAIQKLNIIEMKEIIYNKVKALHAIRYPYNNFLY